MFPSQFVIPAMDLYNMAKDIINDGMDYAIISLLDADDSDPDDVIPPSVHFSACKKHSDAEVDYDDIYVVVPE